MKLTFQYDSVASYEQFLKVRQCPIYDFRGGEVVIPDQYAFMLGKQVRVPDVEYCPSPFLFDYQRDISRLAIKMRKYAIFADCGLGKTFMLLEFAKHAAMATGGKILIVSPLMVCKQTLQEANKWYPDMSIGYVAASNLNTWLNETIDYESQIALTNYEAIREGLIQGQLKGLVLDESSYLKSHYGAWGTRLIELGAGLDWKLCATGTPAPNDRIEFANHAVFLDRAKTVNEFLASYFINRGETQNRWELKPHALKPFYRSLADWSIFLTNPATYGWKDNVGTMPPMHVHIEHVDLTDEQRLLAQQLTGNLITTNVGGIGDRGKLSQIAKGKNGVATNKPAFIRSLVDSWPDESTIIWCNYNEEQESMERVFPDAVSISGDTPHYTREVYLQFFKGEICRCQMEARLNEPTVKSITSEISIDGKSELQKSKQSTTQSDVSNTPRMKQCVSRVAKKPKSGRQKILKSESRSDLRSMESPLSSMIECGMNSEDCVQSANGNHRDGYTSIIATPQESSEVCCAKIATTPSESLVMTQKLLSVPQCTCGGIKQCRILISKPKLVGFGLNLQVCTRQVFSGLKDSYEEYYQAVKRSNRIGSTKPLHIHIPVTELEMPFVDNVLRKAARVESDTREQEELFKEIGCA